MYILLVIQTASDGTVVPAAYKYDTLDAAKAAYYQELAAGAASATLKYDYCAIVNSMGGLLRSELVERSSSDESSETAQD